MLRVLGVGFVLEAGFLAGLMEGVLQPECTPAGPLRMVAGVLAAVVVGLVVGVGGLWGWG